MGNIILISDRLLELNDLINMVLEKHSDILNGKEVRQISIDRKKYVTFA